MENLPAEALTTASTPVKKTRALRTIFELAETVFIALLLFLAMNTLTARVRVDGSSMEPTLHNDELIIVNRLAYRFSQPESGDIIVFHLPHDPETDYIKRIIGLPGDTIAISEKQVYVNGEKIVETYIAAPTHNQGSWTVPQGELFVMGDNRNNSADSRTWGTVPLEDVTGKALIVYWPPENWGILSHGILLAAWNAGETRQ